jgi:hypothetical protein
MTVKRKIIIFVAVFCILAGAVLFMRSPIGIALLKSKRHFIVHDMNTRIRYEPGAEKYATEIAKYLPEALRIVEQQLYVPFKDRFTVYVCATQKSLNEYIAEPSLYPVRGSVLRSDIFISPSAFSFRGQDTHKQTLIHEMAHLHLEQILGFIRYRELPVWFREGVANSVAGSGGEGIGDEEAIRAILGGRHFVVTDKGGIFKPFHGAFSGITPVMFHKQNKMFVQFIRQNYPESFKQLMLDLYAGKPFGRSFSRNFKADVITIWNRFKDHIIIL